MFFKLIIMQFENLKNDKFASLEANELNAIKGGLRIGGGTTINTTTVSPSGNSDDGKDPEDDVSRSMVSSSNLAKS